MDEGEGNHFDVIKYCVNSSILNLNESRKGTTTKTTRRNHTMRHDCIEIKNENGTDRVCVESGVRHKEGGTT